MKFIKMSLVSALTALSLDVSAACLKKCDPDVSKPCGKTCISKELTCHKPTTRACFGERGSSTKKDYANPTYVEASESEKTEKAGE